MKAPKLESAALLLALAGTACSKDEPLALELTEQVGDWNYKMKNAIALELDSETDQVHTAMYDSLGYSYRYMSDEDLNSWENAISRLTLAINSQHRSSKGKIYFPECVSRTANFQTPVENYERLLNLDLQDGNTQFTLGQIENLSDMAMGEAQDMSSEGEGYYHRKPRQQKHANMMMPEAYLSFEAAAAEFKQKTDGWSLSYSDSILTPHELNLVAPNIHFGGQAITIPDGRFKTPDGTEITWSVNPEHRMIIEKELRPAIESSFLNNGAAILHQPTEGRYEVYFPMPQEVCFEQ